MLLIKFLTNQGYGLTESTGGATRAIGPEEAKRYGSAGRLSENMEAKIVDPESGNALTPGQRGELWLRGPAIMKGTSTHLINIIIYSQLVMVHISLNNRATFRFHR